MRWIGVGARLILASAAACGGTGSAPDIVRAAASGIQGGSADTSHSFAVGIIRQNSQGFAICSGALLAPNLVATARHCVSDLPSSAIDCTTSAFGAVTSPANLFVTTDAVIGTSQPFDVARIVVPSGANQTSVCGNDIALLVLAQKIDLPAYVTPAIDPPMTNHAAYTTNVTAIGYGVTSPVDIKGTSAGTRRIRQGIGIVCIPNDSTYALDCYKTDPTAPQYIASNEFVSGDGTCEGDSGSSAFDQGSFSQGKWVSFGVLSRGAVSADAGTCSGAIYSRFDSWAQLLRSTAIDAATVGGYSVPSWAASPSTRPALSEAGASCAASGTLCNGSADCCSNNCLSRDQGVTFACAACDCANPCDVGLACERGVCVAKAASDAGAPNCVVAPAPSPSASPMTSATAASGCACAIPRKSRVPSWYALGVAVALLVAWRRRHVTEHLSESGHRSPVKHR